MTTVSTIGKTQYGGILIPLDPFRLSSVAAVAAEILVSKARNINDAKLVVTRHPQAQLLLARIEGSVVGDDVVEFWRENADIAVAMSQVLPRQCFMYCVRSAPPEQRREMFLVAQRGQVLAADEGDAERQSPGAPHWPVEKLCEQLRLSTDELANDFAGGPTVEVSLIDPNVDDQALLMTLAEPPQAKEGDDGGDEAGAVQQSPGAATQPAAPTKPKMSVAEDIKRRERERADEDAELRRRADEVTADLPFSVDALGIVACPKAELSEPDVLAPFIVSSLQGDLPPGLPRAQTEALQGKRCDIAVKVDFLSEVFVENAPLNRGSFVERASERTIGGRTLQVAEVLAPRLGYGSLISTGSAPHVFVSRKPDLALPEDLILQLLG